MKAETKSFENELNIWEEDSGKRSQSIGQDPSVISPDPLRYLKKEILGISGTGASHTTSNSEETTATTVSLIASLQMPLSCATFELKCCM